MHQCVDVMETHIRADARRKERGWMWRVMAVAMDPVALTTPNAEALHFVPNLLVVVRMAHVNLDLKSVSISSLLSVDVTETHIRTAVMRRGMELSSITRVNVHLHLHLHLHLHAHPSHVDPAQDWPVDCVLTTRP
jgi:hypothetical protein